MRILTGLVFACTALTLGGCAGHWDASFDRYSTKFHQTVPAVASRSVHITNVSGSIIVIAWDKPAVEISAVLHAPTVDDMSRLHVDVSMQGDVMRVATRYGERSILNNIGRSNSGSIDYTLHVPAKLAIRIENVSGDVNIKNVRNNVDVDNVSGSVTAEGIAGSLDIGTTSGDIVANVSAINPSQHFKLSTVSGSTELTIPKKTPADVTASSISGDFSSNLPVSPEQSTVGSEVNQRINGGGAKISLNTVSGAMKLTGK